MHIVAYDVYGPRGWVSDTVSVIARRWYYEEDQIQRKAIQDWRQVLLQSRKGGGSLHGTTGFTRVQHDFTHLLVRSSSEMWLKSKIGW